jgi:hypothetical protein
VRWLAVVACSAGCGRIGFESQAVTTDATTDAPASELLLHFAFDSDGLLRDRAGGNGATCTACPTAIAGRIGDGAAMFAGGPCVHVADAPALRPVAFTIAMWAQAGAAVDTMGLISRPYMGATGNQNTFELYIQTPSNWFVAVSGTDLGVTNVPTSVWHHIAGTFDGSTMVMYLDGGRVGAVAAAMVQYTDDDLVIGCDHDFGVDNLPITGALDDLRFYSRALSDGEVAALAAM